MYNFICFILISFFCLMHNMVAMESKKITIVDNHRKPVHTYNVFDFAKKTKSECARKILISPDESSVLIAKKNGIISRFSFDGDTQEVLIKHHWVEHMPMMAAAKKHSALLIASAGNYVDEESKKNMSELVIWQDGYARTKHFEPLQAIAMDQAGKIVVMANQFQDISIFDVAADAVVSKLMCLKNKDRIIDMAINPRGHQIFVAKEQSVDFIDCYGNKAGFLNQQARTTDHIKRVCFPASEEMVYITSDNTVKALNVYEVLNNEIKPVVLFGSNRNDHVVVDEQTGRIAAFWTKDKNSTDYLRNRILVNKRNKNGIDEYILDVPMSDEKCEYVSKQGYLKPGKRHLLEVALRGTSVVAIGSDGRLHLWKLDEDAKAIDKKIEMPSDLHKYKNNVSPIVQKDKKKPTRSRSNLLGSDDSSDTDEQSPSYTSPRVSRLTDNEDELPSSYTSPRPSKLTIDENDRSLQTSPRISRLTLDEDGNDRELVEIDTDEDEFKLEDYFIAVVEEKK